MKFKNTMTGLVAAFALVAFAAPAVAQDVPDVSGEKTIKVNAKRSEIKFVSEAPQEKIVGKATDLKGSVKMNMDNLAETTGKLAFPVKSMNTGNRMRDRHMRSEEWLNAEANPMISYEVKGLEEAEVVENTKRKIVIKGIATGEVTVNGVAVERKAKVKITIAKKSKRGAHAVKIEPTFTVALAEHNVKGKKGVVGAKVGKTIEISGLVYAAAK